MPKCDHPKKVRLYTQRREGGKRPFRPEAWKCHSCGAVGNLEAKE